MITTRRYTGYTLIELLIALLISSIVVIAFVSSFATQLSTVATQAKRTQIEEDGREVFSILMRLLRTANSSSITITQNANDLLVDFTIPSGFNIWPNTVAPFTNNAVRISWANNGNNANQIRLSNAPQLNLLNVAPTLTLAGIANPDDPQITAMTMNSQGDGSYTLTMTISTGTGAGSNTASRIFTERFFPRN
ncbi:MAG: prepilin-type N-terminal cleavage/methylation domain-containing protein [Gammaproteobacteria bacterium]|nr:prepilin-type N-terminal cleavage/methylation domain-containing protein [Gammaproteobacteria bacterium]